MEKSVINHLLSPQKNRINTGVQGKKLIGVLVISNILLILWIFFKDSDYLEIPVEKTTFFEFNEKGIQSKPSMMSKLLSSVSAKETHTPTPKASGRLSKTKVISPKKATTKKTAKNIDSFYQNKMEATDASKKVQRQKDFTSDSEEISNDREIDQWARLNSGLRSNGQAALNTNDNDMTLFTADEIDPTQEYTEEIVTGTWDIYTDSSGEIYQMIDPENDGNNVIQLEGDEEFTGYRKIFNKPITDKNTLEWEMNYAEDYTVYVSLETTQGHRYLYYTASDFDDLDTNFDYSDADVNDTEIDDNEYIHHGLNKETQNGQWHTISRNYVEDLQDAQPGNTVISADAFLIRGSGLVVDQLKALKR